MVFRIYTKTGDLGDTGLFGGSRVRKDDLRVEAYGTVDELNAALGIAATQSDDAGSANIRKVQGLLFELGAALATPKEKRKDPSGVLDEDVRWLESLIDTLDEKLPPLKTFVLPGGTMASSQVHACRTICRRAERRVVSLHDADEQTHRLAVVFLNRLSDYLFTLARFENHRLGVEDIPWVAR